MKKAAEVKGRALALLGPAAFYVGLLIALGTAFIDPSGMLYVVLAVIGVIVGLLNITAKETGPFLFASIAFIVVALGMQTLITTAGGTLTPPLTVPAWLTRLATNITVLVGAGAVLIALLAIYQMAKGR